MRPAPGWRVEVQAHEVGRWSIEGEVLEVRALDETGARIAAAREVARREGLPQWRPLLRRLYLRCRVVERLNGPADDESGGSVRVRITAKSIDRAAPSPPPKTASREEQHGR